MDVLTDFKRARPEVKQLTPADAELLWVKMLRACHSEQEPADETVDAVDSGGFRLTDRTLDFATPDFRMPTDRRQFRGVLAVASVVAMVIGIAAIQNRSSQRYETSVSPLPVGSPARTQDGWSEFDHPPIDPRFQYAVVSTTSGIFVWGGCCADDSGSKMFSDGAYYDGESDTWRVLPDAPLDSARGDAAATWNGSEVVVVNGVDGAVAAAFDPAAFTWRSIAPPSAESVTGANRLQTLGGGRVALLDDMAVSIWDPTADSWTKPIRIDGIDLSDDRDWWQSNQASTDTTMAVLTTDRGTDCSTLRMRSFDIASNKWSMFAIGTSDWLPSSITGLGGSRFLVAGSWGCDDQRPEDVVRRAAIVDVASKTVSWVAPPPVEVAGWSYGPTLSGDAVTFLGPDGRLAVYRPDSDAWSLGPSMLDVGEPTGDRIGEPNGDRIEETPIVWFDERIVIVSPGFGRAVEGGVTCCFPTSAAWSTALPTAPIVAPEPPLAPQPGVSASSGSVATTDAAPPVDQANGVMFADASSVGGIAGQYTDVLKATQRFDLREPVMVSDEDFEVTVAYARSGSETLAAEVLGQLELEDVEVLPWSAAPPLETETDLTTVGVLVVLGRDVTPAALPDPSSLSVAVLYPPGRSDTADAFVAVLEENGISVDSTFAMSSTLEQTMIMPLGDFDQSSYLLADVLDIDGFDTWDSGIIESPLPSSTTDVLVIGGDATGILIRYEVLARNGFYEVKPGDFLPTIARELGVSVQEIVDLNGLATRDDIFAGQILEIPMDP